MPNHHKTGFAKDRRTDGGKGDLHRHGQGKYVSSDFWGRSDCCNAQINRFNGRDYCDRCGEPCIKTKEKTK